MIERSLNALPTDPAFTNHIAELEQLRRAQDHNAGTGIRSSHPFPGVPQGKPRSTSAYKYFRLDLILGLNEPSWTSL